MPFKLLKLALTKGNSVMVYRSHFLLVYRHGDTCWGLVPVESKQRDCGCNSKGWTGYGFFYGGFKTDVDTCGPQGGGFAGPKENLEKKGDLPSVGLVVKIASLGLRACQLIHVPVDCRTLSVC